MSTLLLATKFYCPPPRLNLVTRPRLIEGLDAGLYQANGFNRKLTLVSAPAGYGKNTLVTTVAVPPITDPNNDEYTRNPVETSVYAQSKFEAFDLIFNVGLRFDMFNPDGQILSDPIDPNINNPVKPSNQFNDSNNNGVYEREQGETPKTVADREAYWYKDASVKYQLSPRIGLAFPISDKGVIHFSYGHFFQLPGYERLYENPKFELGVSTGNAGLLEMQI